MQDWLTGFPYSIMHSLNLDWLLKKVGGDVSATMLQAFTEDEKSMARKNIDAIGASDAASDAKKLDGLPGTYYAPAFNLLSNFILSNPVNQRGLPEYSGIAGAYCIDRWYLTTAAIKLSIDAGHGVVLDNRSGAVNGHLSQKIAGLPDGDYTLAAYLDSGTVLRTFNIQGGRVTPKTYVNTAGAFTAVGYASNVLTVQIGIFPGNVDTIMYAGLYRSLFTVETLPSRAYFPFVVMQLDCMRWLQILSEQFVSPADLRPPMVGDPQVTPASDGKNFYYSCDL